MTIPEDLLSNLIKLFKKGNIMIDEQCNSALLEIDTLANSLDCHISEEDINSLFNCCILVINYILIKFNPLSKIQLHYITSNTLAWTNKSSDEITSNEALISYLSSNKHNVNKNSLKLYLRNITYLLDEYKDTLDNSLILFIRDTLEPFFSISNKQEII